MPRGEHRWNDGRMVSSHGYVKVRVGADHPLADPNGYAYEHHLVWVAAGRAVPVSGSVIHHLNGNKLDNRLENLRVLTRGEHAAEHHRMVPDVVVRAIRERYAGGEDGTAIAECFGLPVSRVYRFIKGESRRSAGGPIFTGSLRGKSAAGRLLDGREWLEVPGGQ